LARHTFSRRYSAAVVAKAAGLNRITLNLWLYRGNIPAKRTSQGRARYFTEEEAIVIFAMADLTRIGVSCRAAHKMARGLLLRRPQLPGWMHADAGLLKTVARLKLEEAASL
jgi:DNA-binding transcriptional MerR regulator